MTVLNRKEFPLEVGKKINIKIVEISGSKWKLKVGKEEFWGHFPNKQGIEAFEGANFYAIYSDKGELIVNAVELNDVIARKVNWYEHERVEEQVAIKTNDERLRMEKKIADNNKKLEETIESLTKDGAGTIEVTTFKGVVETFKDATMEELENGRLKVSSVYEEVLYERDKFISAKKVKAAKSRWDCSYL